MCTYEMQFVSSMKTVRKSDFASSEMVHLVSVVIEIVITNKIIHKE